MALILSFILTIMSQTKSLRLQNDGNNHYKLIQDDQVEFPELKHNLTSFYVLDDALLTLEMKAANLMTLDFYLYPSMQLMNRSEYQHQCEQAFIINKDTVIC